MYHQLFLVMICGVFGSAITAPLHAQQRPNIFIINMDDMGYGDVEPYGAAGYSTPNINALAKQSLALTHFEAAQAVCTASRAALLTGCYPNRIGMHGALLPWTKRALHTKEETIASLVKKAGYQTGIVGKWHLGNKPPYFPASYGFNYFFGLPYSNDMWPYDHRGNHITDTTTFKGKCPPLPLIQQTQSIETITTMQQQALLTSRFTAQATAFIRQHKAKPFLLYLAHAMPHVPIAASTRFSNKSNAGVYGDVIMELDWSVGEIMKALKKEGLENNTILIVTSDNGPWKIFGNHAGSSGGLREGKMTAWEGGTRVPCFIRWPNKIKPGISNALMSNVDLLPTLVQACGASLPRQTIDGLNFLPWLTGKQATSPREVLYYYYDENNLRAVRYNNWKLVLAHASLSAEQTLPGKDGERGQGKIIQVEEGLYHLVSDPGERVNVAALYPDIVKQINHWVQKARADLGDDLTNNKGANRRSPAITD